MLRLLATVAALSGTVAACTLLADTDGFSNGAEPDAAAIDAGVDAVGADAAPTNEAGTSSDGAAGDPYGAAVLADKPTAYYRLDERSGATGATDSSPHGRHGQYSGSFVMERPPLAPALGTSVAFDGNTTILRAGAVGTALERAPFSVELWIRPSRDETDMAVFGRFNQAPSVYELTLEGGMLRFHRGNDTCTAPPAESGVAVGEAAHVVATYDGQAIRLFKNGVFVCQEQSSDELIAGDDFFVGGTFGDFAGEVDEVAVYDYALNPQRVTAHYIASQ